jgi:hypothetical protein
MKKYFLLSLMIYTYAVVLRVIGQLMQGTGIDWKATLLLGELDGSEFEFSKRWMLRVVLIFLLPVLFIKAVGRK